MCGHRISIFDTFMYPLERLVLGDKRNRLLEAARGRVLELGAGTGANLPYYRCDRIRSLTLTDRELKVRALESRLGTLEPGCRRLVSFREADLLRLPFPDASFDTVVATLLFCSVDDHTTGFSEIRRVLVPGGRFLFVEHVLPPDRMRARLFERITPLWRRLAGGCRLDRKTDRELERAGFEIVRLERSGSDVFVGGEARKTDPDAAGTGG